VDLTLKNNFFLSKDGEKNQHIFNMNKFGKDKEIVVYYKDNSDEHGDDKILKQGYIIASKHINGETKKLRLTEKIQLD
jgi:hypothetical protein